MMRRVQMELVHLVIGKAASTLLGLGVLLLLWRRVVPSAYGQYLSLVAAAEVLSLVSALGLSTVAQRHLPIWMAHAATGRQALCRVLQVLFARITLAALFATVFIWGASSFSGGWTVFASFASQPTSLGLILLTVFLRSLEEVQIVLLMQGWVQSLAVAAHAARLMALSQLEQAGGADIFWLIRLELSIAGLLLLVGLWATAIRTLRGLHLDDALLRERPSPLWDAWLQSLQFWMTQCLGLAWSIHALRLLLQSVAGPTAVAVHGAAQAMVDSLRQATPLVWGTGWLRAAMLRLQAASAQPRAALELASAVHRLSLWMLWPVVAAWCIDPSEWFQWVAGSEMHAKARELSADHPWAPSFTGLLTASALLAPLQNRHLLISLWAYVQQRPAWGLAASVAAVFPVLAFVWLWTRFGLWAVPLVMLSAELLWVGTAARAWVSDTAHREDRFWILQIPLLSFAAAWLVSVILDQAIEVPAVLRLILPLLTAMGVVMAWVRSKSLLTPDERTALMTCLPSVARVWPLFFGAKYWR